MLAQVNPKNDKKIIRTGQKTALMIAMLRRPNGATIEDLRNATGWQAHSVRGALSGMMAR